MDSSNQNAGAHQIQGTDSARRDALARSIEVRLSLCNEDELRVVDVVLGRLETGRDRYGFLDLSKARDWDAEEAEELLDARIYRACDVLKRRDEKLKRLRCEAADETSRAFDLSDLGGEG